MTVSSQTSTATFVGNGVATAFPLPFRFFDNGDIRAYFIDSVTGAATQMLLGTDYTLIGAGEPEVDGNALSLLTTTAPLASMRGLYVERFMPQTQSTDLVNQGEFFASTHEDVFDRLTMLIQQQVTETNKAKAEADEALDTAELALDTAQDALALVGERTQYMVLGPYGPGLYFQTTSQVFSYLGEFYAPGPSITLPYTTTGVGAAEVANFRSVGDAILRADLASDTDPAKGAGLVGFKGRTVYEKLSDIGSVKDAGAVGDGVEDDTGALQSAIASGDVRADGGVFSASDAVPTVPFHGTGEISRPGGRVNLSPIPQISISTFSKSTQPLSAINQMGMQVSNGLLYVVNQGSYNGSQQGTFDIFDVSSGDKVTRLSSLNIGAVGDIPRALSVFGQYAYVRNFSGGTVRIVDVSNPISPVVLSTETLLAGNSEHSVIIGRALIYTKLTGGVDFYDISNPLLPRHISSLTLPGVLHRPAVDGDGFWVTSHNDGTTNNLFYVDCSDLNNPQVTSSSRLPTLKYCRFTSLQGRYLYAGGMDTSSRWNVIDVADRSNPVVVYTDPSAQGKIMEACGDVLIAGSLLYDITNPVNPVLFGSVGPDLYKIQLYGNRAIGFGESTGPKGPAGNDSNADTYVVSVELNGIRMPAANIEHLKTKRVYAEDISVRNSVSASAVSAGRGGVHTLGVASSNKVVNASGNYQNGQLQATGMAVVIGLLSDPVALFKVHTSRTVLFRLRYHLVNNNSLGYSASTAIGEKVWSGFISSVGVWNPLISPVDVYTPFKNNLDLPLTVTVSTNGTPGSPATISVQAGALSSGAPAGFFELSVSSYLPCRIERLV